MTITDGHIQTMNLPTQLIHPNLLLSMPSFQITVTIWLHCTMMSTYLIFKLSRSRLNPLLHATDSSGLAPALSLTVDGNMTPRLCNNHGTTIKTCYPTVLTTPTSATHLPTLPRFYQDLHPCSLGLTKTTLALPGMPMTPITPPVTPFTARILAVVTLLLLTMLPPLLHSKG